MKSSLLFYIPPFSFFALSRSSAAKLLACNRLKIIRCQSSVLACCRLSTFLVPNFRVANAFGVRSICKCNGMSPIARLTSQCARILWEPPLNLTGLLHPASAGGPIFREYNDVLAWADVKLSIHSRAWAKSTLSAAACVYIEAWRCQWCLTDKNGGSEGSWNAWLCTANDELLHSRLWGWHHIHTKWAIGGVDNICDLKRLFIS